MMQGRSRTLSSPPPGGGRSVREANREGVNLSFALSPHPDALRASTLPLKERVKRARGVVCAQMGAH